MDIAQKERGKTMPRLIDANEILKEDHQHYDYMSDEFYVTVRDIENAPKVDAVEVVWCKDCKYHCHDKKGIPYCSKIDYGYGWHDNDYCSKGERKDAKIN